MSDVKQSKPSEADQELAAVQNELQQILKSHRETLNREPVLAVLFNSLLHMSDSRQADIKMDNVKVKTTVPRPKKTKSTKTQAATTTTTKSTHVSKLGDDFSKLTIGRQMPSGRGLESVAAAAHKYR
jgi:hypothetical protein